MAERESSIVKWGKSQGLSEAEAFKKLGEYHDKFQTLYVDGPFITWSDDDLAAHRAFASVFKNSPELLRAYNDYRQEVENEDSIDEALESARNSYGVAGVGRAIGDAFGGSFDEKSFKEILGGFGIEKVGDKIILPYQSKQGLEEFNENIKDRGLSDEEVEEERQKDLIDEMRAEQEAMQQGRQGQNVFLDRDPQIGAVRQQVRAAADNPFLFGTEGKQSQIEDLLDKAGRKIPAPDRSDARSVARFNNDFSSREFVRDAALRKQRELANLDRNHRNLVNSQGMQDTMMKWIVANPDHAMSEKGLANWTDQDKIAFAKNYKMGNFDDPAPAPKGVPMFDKDGLMGFQSEQTVKDRIGDKTFRVDPNKPNRAQMMERRNNQMLDEIRNEENPLKPGQKTHPFEMFGGSTDYAAEVASREPVSMSNPAPQRDDRYKNPAYSQQNPLVNRDDRYKNPAYSQQTPISKVDQVRKDVNAEVNDVLNQVSIPGSNQNSDILDRAPVNATPVPSRRKIRNQKPAPLDIPARTWPDYTGY